MFVQCRLLPVKNCLTSKRVWVSLGMCSWNCQSRADRFHLEYLAFHIFQILCFDILIFTLNLIYLKFGVFIFFSVLTCAICQYQYQPQPEFGKPCIQSKSRPDQWPVWSRILYFKCFAEYWIHFAACLATFSLIFKNTEKSRMNLWAVTCCLE